MGRIAELLEKKALGTLSEAEKKELELLKKEADLDRADEPDVPEGTEGADKPDQPSDDDVDEAAQKMADSITASMDSKFDRIDKVLKSLEEKKPSVETKDALSTKIFVDKKLGEKTVGELNDMKVELIERKTAGKKNTEVSLGTVKFLQALVNKDIATVEKLQPLLEGTGARGGFLVPDDFANIIVEDVRDQNQMRQYATVLTTQSDTLRLPSLASRPKATFRAEAAVKSTSTADFAENVFTPYSLASIVTLSNELVADAQLGVGGSIVNYIANIMSTALAEREELAFWEGNGTAQPTGVDNYTLRTVAAGAGASDTARADALIAGFIQTPQGYRNRGVWAMNMGTLENVMQLKDTTNNYLVSRLPDSPQMTIKGRPIIEVNSLPGGTAFFGDFSYYYIVDREGINVRVSDEATVASQSAFERNLTHVRVEKRVDGELVLTAAVTEVTGLGTP